MPAKKGYTITVGGKKFTIKLPSILSGGKALTKENAPFSMKRALQDKQRHLNELDALDQQMKDVGRSEIEKEIFDN